MSSFTELYEAMKKKELLLLDGGMCLYHKCKQGRLTIYIILVLDERQGEGIGTKILDYLKQIHGVTYIFARCPADLPSNKWYKKRGFQLCRVDTLPSKRVLNSWRLDIDPSSFLMDLQQPLGEKQK